MINNNANPIENLPSLNSKWSLWEMYKAIDEQDYAAQMKKLVTFNDLKEFCEIWTHLPHCQPSKLFYERGKNEIKKYKIETKNEFKQIETICLFRDNIEPTWEDPHNANGGIQHYVFSDLSAEEMDNLWLYLTTSLVMSEDILYSNKINGLRFCDKTKPPKILNYKLEVWLESGQFNGDERLIEDINRIIKDCELPASGFYKPNKVDKR